MHEVPEMKCAPGPKECSRTNHDRLSVITHLPVASDWVPTRVAARMAYCSANQNARYGCRRSASSNFQSSSADRSIQSPGKRKTYDGNDGVENLVNSRFHEWMTVREHANRSSYEGEYEQDEHSGWVQINQFSYYWESTAITWVVGDGRGICRGFKVRRLNQTCWETFTEKHTHTHRHTILHAWQSKFLISPAYNNQWARAVRFIQAVEDLAFWHPSF